jgi:hypothetical protein
MRSSCILLYQSYVKILLLQDTIYNDFQLKTAVNGFTAVVKRKPLLTLQRLLASCYYIAHSVHFFFIFLQLIISSKSSLLLLQELPTGNLFFDRFIADPYSPLSSHQHCKFFSIWTVNFCCKIKIH